MITEGFWPAVFIFIIIYVVIRHIETIKQGGEKMESYFIEMLTDQPRRMAVLRNTVKNRRTVATLFWAQAYNLFSWLGAAPKLEQNDFDHWFEQMRQAGMIQIADQMAWLTPAGLAEKEKFKKTRYQPHFGQWSWVTRVDQIAPRVLLASQAISEYAYQQKRYIPLNLSPGELYRVRRWFYHHTVKITDQWSREIQLIAATLAKTDQRLAQLLVFSLPGHLTPGWTLNQAAQALTVSVDETKVMERDVWLAVALMAQANPQSLMFELIGDRLHQSPISNSARQTLSLFQQGMSLAEISYRRHLKIGTIREHLLEAAIFVPSQIDVSRLISVQHMLKLKQIYHGQPISWEFQAPIEHPQSTTAKMTNEEAFFEFRLWQILSGGRQHG